MKSNKKWHLPVLFAAIGIFLIVNALSRLQTPHPLSQILPVPPEQVNAWEVRFLSNGGTSARSLTQEQAEQLLQLLEGHGYQYSASGSALPDCYARLFLLVSGRYRVELMLAPNAVLVHDLDAGGNGFVYTIFPDGAMLREYLLSIIG